MRNHLGSIALVVALGVAFLVTSKTKIIPDTIPPSSLTNPNVTEANIRETICTSGWTGTVRPPVSYTNKIKNQLLSKMKDQVALHYELDHAIPIELGGNPSDPKNLWLEPYNNPVTFNTDPPQKGNLGAREKDQIETYLKREVCAGIVTLSEAQKEILNWPENFIKIKNITLVEPSNTDE